MREILLLRMATDPVVRVWSGAGPLAVPTDTVETEDTPYSGLGELLNLPAVEQLINGVSQKVSFTVSGVSAEMLALAQADRATVRGATVWIGTLILDDDLQPVDGVDWEWRGKADTLELASTPNGDDRVRTVTLTVAAADATRTRADLAFFTDADQRRRSPDDLFFNQIASYSAGTTVRFGPTG